MFAGETTRTLTEWGLKGFELEPPIAAFAGHAIEKIGSITMVIIKAISDLFAVLLVLGTCMGRACSFPHLLSVPSRATYVLFQWSGDVWCFEGLWLGGMTKLKDLRTMLKKMFVSIGSGFTSGLRLKNSFKLWSVERLIVRDERFVFTLVSFAMILLVFVNQVTVSSLVVGVFSSFVFVVLNIVFLANALFRSEVSFVRLMLGGMVFLLLLGVSGWIVLIAYNLDAVRSAIVLCVVGVLSSALNRVGRKSSGGV